MKTNTTRWKTEYERYFSASLHKATDLVVDLGRGPYLYTVDGEEYLDMVQGIAVNQLGHAHPELIEAAVSQIRSLGHASFNLITYPVVLEFAKALAAVTPKGLDTFFFTNSGAEAVEGALKLARFVTRKPAVIAFKGAFHGRTFGAASVTASKAGFRKHYAPFLPQIYFAPYPYCFRCPFGRREPDCNLECLQYLEADFDCLIPPEDVGAVLFELVQGEGGYIVPPAKYVSALRELCNRHGFLLITDEIQTGMGRTGKMFACDHFDITPDIMTLGKAVGGGYPMAVVAASHALMQKWPPGAHGTTFGGHPLPAAAGKAQLSIISDPDFLKAVQRKGESVRQRLSALKPRFAHVGDVRGLGLMNAVEFVKTGGAPDPVRAQQVVARLFQEKILVLTCGVKGNIIRLIPPLNIEDSLLDRVMDCIEAALKTG